MRPRNASLTLDLQVAPSLPTPPSRRKKLSGEPDFQRPPLWIHASVAVFLSSPREAKRRKILALLDRIPLRSGK
jgi:hypothetical protein